jgi:hypothetical protein
MTHISDSQPEVMGRMVDEIIADHPWLRLARSSLSCRNNSPIAVLSSARL